MLELWISQYISSNIEILLLRRDRMNIEAVAKCLAELGHTTRLEIFRYLVKGGRQGVPVGELQSVLGVPGSTLSHHITKLVNVGLVAQRREGRTLYCVPQFEELNAILEFLQEECCVNEFRD